MTQSSGPSNPLAATARSALLPTLLVGPAAIALAAALGGGRAALGSAVGYAVTVAFFLLGMIVMMRFAADTAPLLFMATALAVFFGQLIFLLVVILLLQDADWLDGRAFGLTALALALVWQVFSVWGYLRARRHVFDVPAEDEAPAGERVEGSPRHTA